MIVLLLPLLVGVALLVAAHMAARWFAYADPQKLAKMLRSGSGLLLMLLGLLLLLRGQLVLGGSLVAAGFSRFATGHPGSPFPGGRSRRGAPRPGQSSTVRTALLEATLDHDTGEMDAEILAGRFEGRRLSQLADGEVLALWGDAAAAGDEESRLLLEAYLDRRRPEWREDVEGDRDGGAGGAGGARARGTGAMTEEDAYDVLGLQPGASEAEIRAAHRRLMKQMHPDQGGSTFLAAKLNEAKDVLLRRR